MRRNAIPPNNKKHVKICSLAEQMAWEYAQVHKEHIATEKEDNNKQDEIMRFNAAKCRAMRDLLCVNAYDE